MESGMTAGPGAAGLGQEPEREEGDFRISEEDLRDENLQGSIDVVIEDWKSPDFLWWASQPEGQVALQLLFQVGEKIGEYRARKNRPAPTHQPNIDPTEPSPSQQHAADVAAENEHLRDELAQMKAALEAQKVADTERNPEGYGETPAPPAEEGA